MAGNAKVRFHIAGVILILIGIGGAFLSLLWDVIYKSTAFSLGAVGPYKLLGLAAGIVIAIAGLIAGLVLGRRAAVRAGTGDIHSQAMAYKLVGLLLVIGGLGGTFLSLLWDVIRRGKPFSAAAIGPMKMIGIAAGIILVVIGIVMISVLARKRAAAPAQAGAASIQPVAAPQQPTMSAPLPEAGYPTAPAPAFQSQTPDAGYQPAQAPEYYPQAAETDVGMQQPVQAQEEIPFALSLEEASPAQAGAEPMEAIPIEEPQDDRPSAERKDT